MAWLRMVWSRKLLPLPVTAHQEAEAGTAIGNEVEVMQEGGNLADHGQR